MAAVAALFALPVIGASVAPGPLKDEDVANVLTYVFSQWGNAGHVVTPAQVQAAWRAAPARRGSSPDGH